MKPSRVRIEKVLSEFLKAEELSSAREINGLCCGEFSYALYLHFRKRFKCVQYETADFNRFPFHCFTKIGGKYCDADRLDGVTNPLELPVFANFHNENPQVAFEMKDSNS